MSSDIEERSLQSLLKAVDCFRRSDGVRKLGGGARRRTQGMSDCLKEINQHLLRSDQPQNLSTTFGVCVSKTLQRHKMPKEDAVI